MSRSDLSKVVAAVLILALAAVLLARFIRRGDNREMVFFYDLSEQKLFTAPRTSVPPIKGIHGSEQDAMRAVVISTNGNPADRSSWVVAYLEKYSQELKHQIENAQAEGGSPAMGRAQAVAHRFVRRLRDPEWFPLNSPQGEQIVTEWANPGPNGITPVVCTP